MAQIHDPTLREIGAKLANFRRKLGDAIGKKIIQEVFGEMYGEYTPRNIETYEGGRVEIPAKLFFILWQQGNSIDAIFAESAVTEAGREQARKLFDQSLTARYEAMDEEEKERLRSAVGESNHVNKGQLGPTQKATLGTFGSRKGGPTKTGKIKKR